MFDFQCVHLTKLECRHSLKSLQTFAMIRDDVTLSQCTSSSYSIPSHVTTGHSLFHLLLSKKKTNLHEPFHTATFYHDAPNSHIQGIDFLKFLEYTLYNTNEVNTNLNKNY